MPLRVQIVTAEREVFAAEGVDMVVAPGPRACWASCRATRRC